MAAAGGDTVVPTNWTGLILTTVVVAVVAAGAYFGFGMVLGDADGGEAETHETSLQELYSFDAKRGIEAMETVRALPRSVLAPSSSLPPPDAPSDGAESSDDEMADAMSDADEDSAADAEAEAAAAEAEAEAEAASIAAEMERKAAAAKEAAAEAARAAADKAREMAAAASEAVRSTAETLDTRYRATTTALRAWWNDLGESPLGVRFIGPLDSSVAEHGLAILFDQPVDAQTAASFITLTRNGSTVSTNWMNGDNPALIYAAGLSSGSYKLTLGEDLPSRSGNALSQTVSGDAFVN